MKRFYINISNTSKEKWLSCETCSIPKKRSKATWIILSSKINKSLLGYMFAPSSQLLTSSYYLDLKPFAQYNVNMVKFRNSGIKNNRSILYSGQNYSLKCLKN